MTLQSERFVSQLSAYDDHPGALVGWPEDCRQAFTQGVLCAQAWLGDDDSGWLWANMIVERDSLPRAGQRRAFEVGFLSRIHQRLCSPQGGRHQARQAVMQL